jgi:RNA polymerase sigma factor (sigma-70 family)
MSADMVEEAASEETPPGDEVLLARFVDHRDEAAFRQLVERHAALVLSVCRRAAPSPADADDAFQATFIVLAQAAHKVRKPASLAAWLYGVAYRVSARLRREAARHKAQPLDDSMATACDPLDELLARHEEAITDEELAALPASLRTPFVLRYLAGHSNTEVAAKLGVSVAAIEGRLKRAKQRLRSRLIRRGLTLATAVVILKSTRVAADEVPAALVNVTLEICLGSGVAAATTTGTASASAQPAAIQLAHQEVIAMKTMLLTKPIIAAIVAGCALTFAVGVTYIPFPGSEAIAQRMGLSKGPDGEVTRGRDDARVRMSVEFGELKIPTLPPQPMGAAGEPALDVFDRKPRSATERAIAAALTTVVSRLEYSNAPLEAVIQDIQNLHAIPVMIDNSALEDAGLGPDEPVTFAIKGISLRAALRSMLRQHNLTYIVKDEVLLITTPTEAEENLETRVYPLDDRASVTTLESLIKAHVLSNTWIESGGTASATGYSNGLVVTQTYEGHELIHDLLKQLGWPSRVR